MGLDKIGVYIAHQQKTVTKYIANFLIMVLYLAAERRPGVQLSRRWWEQPALEILEIRTGHAEA